MMQVQLSQVLGSGHSGPRSALVRFRRRRFLKSYGEGFFDVVGDMDHGPGYALFGEALRSYLAQRN
jgi:hypothetical protein